MWITCTDPVVLLFLEVGVFEMCFGRILVCAAIDEFGRESKAKQILTYWAVQGRSFPVIG